MMTSRILEVSDSNVRPEAGCLPSALSRTRTFPLISWPIHYSLTILPLDR